VREYPSRENPGHVRTLMQVAHDRYAAGIDLFPIVRLYGAETDVLPRKTQHAASLLLHAWSRIDKAEAMFTDGLQTIREVGSGFIMARIGQNAVRAVFINKDSKIIPTCQFHIDFLTQTNQAECINTVDKSFVAQGVKLAQLYDNDSLDIALIQASRATHVILASDAAERIVAEVSAPPISAR
jgi:hypothetical protein